MVGWGRQDLRGQMEGGEGGDEMGGKEGLWGGSSHLPRISRGQSKTEGLAGKVSCRKQLPGERGTGGF